MGPHRVGGVVGSDEGARDVAAIFGCCYQQLSHSELLWSHSGAAKISSAPEPEPCDQLRHESRAGAELSRALATLAIGDGPVRALAWLRLA